MANIAQEDFYRIFGARETAACVEQEEYAGPHDRAVLLALVLAVQPKSVMEIGVNEGRTARLLLAHCDSIETYVGVDVAPDFEPANKKQAPEVPKEIGHLVEDKRFEAVTCKNGSTDLPRRKVGKAIYDLIFIDGSHAEDDVRADTEWAMEHVAPGGAIAWHDYVSERGVQAVVDCWNQANGNRIHLVDGTWVCFYIANPAT